MVFVVAFHVGTPFFIYLITFFSSRLFSLVSVAQNELVDRDKGKFNVKDDSVVISLDDLLS